MSNIKICSLIAERHPVDRLIRYKEMIHRTGFSRITLYRWSNSSRNQKLFIPPVRKNGRIIGWRESDYQNWLKQELK